MHAIESSGNVPAFLTKLWRLVDDHRTNDLISWTQNGRSFIIQNQARFARELLPQYYKHNNMASFVRQLNMYGFHKVVSADSGGLRVEKDEMEFAHPAFQKGHEDLIENIKRKQQRRLASDGMDFSQIPTSRSNVDESPKIGKLLNDVRDMKRDHEVMSTKLLGLKRENEALWREYANMRQKFSKQQQIIEKLIHFLIAMVKSPAKQMIPKRKFGHLALEGGDDLTAAAASLSSLPQLSQNVDFDSPTSSTAGGARIHEVTDFVDADDTKTLTNIFTPESEHSSFQVEDVTDKDCEMVYYPTNNEDDTILLVNGEPFDISSSVTVPNSSLTYSAPTTVTASSVASPTFSTMVDTQTPKTAAFDRLLDEAPLSPELLHTVDPSAVTQSFKYPAPAPSPTIKTSTSTGTKVVAGPSKVQVASKTLQMPTSKGKSKGMKVHKGSNHSTMSVAVPEKTFNKPLPDLNEIIDLVQFPTGSFSPMNSMDITQASGSAITEYPTEGDYLSRNDLQNYMEDMQTSIDSLQEMISSGGFNVDPSVLLSVFGNEETLPDLDSIVPSASSVFAGTELSVYHPSLLDLAEIAEDTDEDPLSFLVSSVVTSPTASPSTSTAAQAKPIVISTSTGPPALKPLRLTIKKERADEDELMTPKVMSPSAPSPVFRGKKRRN